MKALENKIPPPLVAIISAVAMWFIAGVDISININEMLKVSLVVFLCVLGLAFMLSGLLSFKFAKTTVNPLKPDTASALVTSGIYKVTRNPMYVGFVVFLLAWVIYLASAWSLLGAAIFIAYIHYFQILPEERALLALFGQEYKEYMAKVRRWV